MNPTINSNKKIEKNLEAMGKILAESIQKQMAIRKEEQFIQIRLQEEESLKNQQKAEMDKLEFDLTNTLQSLAKIIRVNVTGQEDPESVVETVEEKEEVVQPQAQVEQPKSIEPEEVQEPKEQVEQPTKPEITSPSTERYVPPTKEESEVVTESIPKNVETYIQEQVKKIKMHVARAVELGGGGGSAGGFSLGYTPLDTAGSNTMVSPLVFSNSDVNKNIVDTVISQQLIIQVTGGFDPQQPDNDNQTAKIFINNKNITFFGGNSTTGEADGTLGFVTQYGSGSGAINFLENSGGGITLNAIPGGGPISLNSSDNVNITSDQIIYLQGDSSVHLTSPNQIEITGPGDVKQSAIRFTDGSVTIEAGASSNFGDYGFIITSGSDINLHSSSDITLNSDSEIVNVIGSLIVTGLINGTVVKKGIVNCNDGADTRVDFGSPMPDNKYFVGCITDFPSLASPSDLDVNGFTMKYQGDGTSGDHTVTWTAVWMAETP